MNTDRRNNGEKIFPTPGNTIVFVDRKLGVISKKFHKPNNKDTADKIRNKSHYEQLCYLKKNGINVPNDIRILGDYSQINYRYVKGNTLEYHIKKRNPRLREWFSGASHILTQAQNKLADNQRMVQKIAVNDESLNYHNARNFLDYTVKWLQQESVNEFENDFQKAILLTKKILQKNNYYLQNVDYIYGDFKPDNIIIESTTNNVVLIDPLISKARMSCDVGKFASRVLLADIDVYRNEFMYFIRTYMKLNQTVTKKELEFMTVCDILNHISRKLILVKKGGVQIHEKVYLSKVLNEYIPQLLNGEKI